MDPISRLNKLAGELTSWLYAFVFLITIHEIVARYFFNSPTIWVLELSLTLAGIQYAIGGAYAMQRGEHVSIDVIYRLAGPRTRRVLDIVNYLIILAVLGVIVHWGVLQAQASMIHGWQRTGGAWNSAAPVYMKIAIPVAGILMAAQTLVLLVKRIREPAA